MPIPHVPRRIYRFWSFKFAILTIFALFFISNLTGVSFSRVFAPVRANILPEGDYIPADVPSSGMKNLDLVIFRAGARYGVDPRLIHAVIWQESRYNPSARSGKGAQGLMQMTPATARRFDCQDASDPQANVEAGTRYVRWLLERFNGDIALTLAAYNAGEGSVDKYNGIPPFNGTQNYVRAIINRYGKTFHPVLTPEQARNEFHLAEEIAAR